MLATEFLKLKKRLTGEKATKASAAAQLQLEWQNMQSNLEKGSITETDLGQILFVLSTLAKAHQLSPETALISHIQKMTRDLPQNTKK